MLLALLHLLPSILTPQMPLKQTLYPAARRGLLYAGWYIIGEKKMKLVKPLHIFEDYDILGAIHPLHKIKTERYCYEKF